MEDLNVQQFPLRMLVLIRPDLVVYFAVNLKSSPAINILP